MKVRKEEKRKIEQKNDFRQSETCSKQKNKPFNTEQSLMPSSQKKLTDYARAHEVEQ